MTTNLHTPFQSIHKRKVLKRSSSPTTSSTQTTTLSGKDAKELLKKTWLTFACSPLHQFKTDHQSLEQYSRLLSATFVACKQKRVGIGLDDEDTPTKAIFSIVKGLAVTTDEPDAVKLSVYTMEKKKVCEVYLCSVKADSLIDNVYEYARVMFPGTKQTVHDQFTVYPLIICKGNIGSRKLLFEWLQNEFDCNISKLNFNSLSLAWMLTMWCNLFEDDKNFTSSKILWSLPSVSGIDHIETVFEGESLNALWKASRSSTSDDITVAEVDKLIQGIEEHFTSHFRIKFKALPIQQLHLGIVYLHADGKIKMFSKNHIHTVLSHLTCLAVELLQWKSTEKEPAD